MWALRDAGSCTGVVMGRHTVLLPVLRAAAMAPLAAYRERLVSRRAALCDCPGGKKSRPWASSQDSRGRRDASDEYARGDPALVPDVEATRFLDNENKDYVRQ